MSSHVGPRRTSAVTAAAAVAGAICLALVTSEPIVQASTVLSAAGLKEQSALAAAKSKGSVHYFQREFSGQLDEEIVADIGPTSGTQKITFTVGKEKGSMTAVLVGGVVYLMGSAFALEGVVGFTPSAAKRVAGRWISVPQTAVQYALFAVGLSMPTLIGELQTSGPVTEAGTTQMLGTTVLRLQGSVAKTQATPSAGETLFVQAKGSPLPVSALEILAAGQGSFTFSHWGEHVGPVAPPHSTAFSPTFLATS